MTKKNDRFYSSYGDQYFACNYCGGDCLVKQSEVDQSVFYIKCEACEKALDNYWNLECEVEELIKKLTEALHGIEKDRGTTGVSS